MVQPDDALAVLGKKFRADRIKPRPLVIVERNVKTRKRRLNRFDRLQDRTFSWNRCASRACSIACSRLRTVSSRPGGVAGTIDLFVRLRQNIGAAVEPAKRRQHDVGGIKLHALRLAATRPSARAYP